jgi:hypothetical protein
MSDKSKDNNPLYQSELIIDIINNDHQFSNITDYLLKREFFLNELK